MTIWIGTSGFQYPEWKGGFYPEDLPASKMLAYYAERFRSTEINYSFRRIPNPKTIAKWREGTPADFRFSFKAPQKITHHARLEGSKDTLKYFAKVLSPMGPKLGPILFQLPPTLKADAKLLRNFLRGLPKGLRAAFEFRDPSWFTEEIYEVLRQGRAALCIAESDELQTPSVATASFGYLRLRREDYKVRDLTAWAEFVKGQQAWSECFMYFKHEDRGVGPKFGSRMMRALGMAGR